MIKSQTPEGFFREMQLMKDTCVDCNFLNKNSLKVGLKYCEKREMGFHKIVKYCHFNPHASLEEFIK